MPWYVCLLEVRGQPKAVCFFLLHVFWGLNSKVKCLYLLLGIFSADFFFLNVCGILPTRMPVCHSVSEEARRGIGCHGTGFAIGVGNCTHVLWKNSQCS